MAEQAIAKPGKKLTKNQAIILMVSGGIMLGLPMVISTETGTTAHTIKMFVAILGACVLFVGAYLRPMKASGGGI